MKMPTSSAGTALAALTTVASLTSVLALAALTISLVTLPAGVDPFGSEVVLIGGLLAVGFFAAERFVVHLSVGRETQTFSLSEIPLVLGLYFAPPIVLVVGQVVGAALALRLHRRQELRKLTFNLANFAFGTALAVLLFRVIASSSDPTDPRSWLAAYVAAFVADRVQGFGVALAIAISEGSALALPRLVEVGGIYTLADTSLGIVAALVLSEQPLAAPLLAALAFVTFFGYRAYQSEMRKNEALDEMQRSTRAIQRITSMRDVRFALLDGARKVFGAERAEILIFADSEHPALRSTLDVGGVVRTEEIALPEVPTGMWSRVLGEGRGVSVSHENASPTMRQQLGRDSIHNALLAPIHDEERIIGVLEVANRQALVGDWTDDDVTLFETLANQASVSIANAQLVDRLRELAEEQHRLAVTDPLTGLPNRLQFRYWLAAEIEAMHPFGIMLLDIDRFKEINDTLGHHNGDLVLVEIGERLREAVAGAGELARAGGDEFMLLVRDPEPRAAVERVGRAVTAALQRRFELRNIDLRLQGSLGAAVFPRDGNDPDELIQHADVAMYLAKQRGDSFELYDADEDPYDELTLAVTGDLQRAIEEDRLNVLFQPQLGVTSGRIEAAEALIRWRHPRRGDVSPDLFVPIADRTGLIRPLTRLVLRTALVECRRWLKDSLDISVAVNLSARNLRESDLPDFVSALMTEMGVPPERLTLEVTESAVMTEDVLTADVIAGLAASGVDLAVDDFGTGYSSLAYLKRLPANEIKIDRAFVRNMIADRQDDAIVAWTVALSRLLGRRTVAEGVEDAATLARLTEIGCDRVQGYHISRPIAARGVADLAQARQRTRRRRTRTVTPKTRPSAAETQAAY